MTHGRQAANQEELPPGQFAVTVRGDHFAHDARDEHVSARPAMPVAAPVAGPRYASSVRSCAPCSRDVASLGTTWHQSTLATIPASTAASGSSSVIAASREVM